MSPGRVGPACTPELLGPSAPSTRLLSPRRVSFSHRPEAKEYCHGPCPGLAGAQVPPGAGQPWAGGLPPPPPLTPLLIFNHFSLFPSLLGCSFWGGWVGGCSAGRFQCRLSPPEACGGSLTGLLASRSPHQELGFGPRSLLLRPWGLLQPKPQHPPMGLSRGSAGAPPDGLHPPQVRPIPSSSSPPPPSRQSSGGGPVSPIPSTHPGDPQLCPHSPGTATASPAQVLG